MDEEAKAVRREYLREYHREWRKKNPQKVKAATERYWMKKAQQAIKEQGE